MLSVNLIILPQKVTINQQNRFKNKMKDRFCSEIITQLVVFTVQKIRIALIYSEVSKKSVYVFPLSPVWVSHLQKLSTLL